MPRKQESPHVTSSLDQVHTWQLINRVQCQNQGKNHQIQEPHHHKQKRNFSLFSVRSKFTNPEKVQEHSNPNRFSRIEIQHRSYKIREVLSDSYQIIITEPLSTAIQVRVRRRWRQTSSTITMEPHSEQRRRRKTKNSRISNCSRRRRSNYQFISGFQREST